MILAHDPFQPTPDSPDWDPEARGEWVNRSPRHFIEMIASMNRMVGRLNDHLGELGLRERTLLIVLGDNGTNRGIVSRFEGRNYPGGKGTTTRHDHHVPLVVSWPGKIQGGRVSSDLVAAVDFLPTVCQAAGVAPPAGIDGASFLPQILGEPGQPRSAIFSWYSPRQNNARVIVSAFDPHLKRYGDGRLFNPRTDPLERRPLDFDRLSHEQAGSHERLKALMDRFADARPAELDRLFDPEP